MNGTRQAVIAVVALVAVSAIVLGPCAREERDAGTRPLPEEAVVRRPVAPRARTSAAREATGVGEARPGETGSPPTPSAEVVRIAGTRGVTVTVVDDAGRPIRGAEVGVRPDSPLGHDAVSVNSAFVQDETWPASVRDGRREFVTDSSGVAHVAAPAGDVTVSSWDPVGPARRILPPLEADVPSQQEKVTIVLPAGDWVRGRAVDDAGRPVVGARIEFRTPDGFRSRNEKRTDDTGQFEIAVPRGSTGELRVAALVTVDGNAWSEGGDWECDGSLDGVAAGSIGVVLRCRLLPQDRSVTFLVVDPDGNPVPEARVKLRRGTYARGGHYENGGRVGADGRLRLDRLPACELFAQAMPTRAGPQPLAWGTAVAVVPDGQEVILRLRRSQLVRGIVARADGSPVRNGTVEVRSGDEAIAFVGTAEEGAFVAAIPADRTGSVRLTVRDLDRLRLRAVVELPLPCADRDVRIVVGRE